MVRRRMYQGRFTLLSVAKHSTTQRDQHHNGEDIPQWNKKLRRRVNSRMNTVYKARGCHVS